MAKPEISGIAPLFIVKNVPAALAVYRDRLGFDIAFGGEGGVGAVSAGVAETIVLVGLILGVVGFVAGFWWEFRRACR